MTDPRIILINHFLLDLWNRIIEIIHSPLQIKEMLFILAPLIVVLFVIELYFGRYKYEKLGWNTAVGNSLALVFVGMNLLNYLYTNGEVFGINPKTLLAFIVCIEALFLLFVNFFHIFPREAAFGISSPLILNFIGIASIIMVYSEIPFDYTTLIAFIILFLILVIVISLIKSLESPAIPKVKIGREKLPVPEENA